MGVTHRGHAEDTAAAACNTTETSHTELCTQLQQRRTDPGGEQVLNSCTDMVSMLSLLWTLLNALALPKQLCHTVDS
jgi:hypothetical protein